MGAMVPLLALGIPIIWVIMHYWYKNQKDERARLGQGADGRDLREAVEQLTAENDRLKRENERQGERLANLELIVTNTDWQALALKEPSDDEQVSREVADIAKRIRESQ